MSFSHFVIHPSHTLVVKVVINKNNQIFVSSLKLKYLNSRNKIYFIKYIHN
jgi:hypothetical protein